MSRGQKCLLRAIRPHESLLHQLEKVAFSVGQEAENVFKVTFDNFKYRFFDFTKIAFPAGPDAEYEFAVPCNHWKSCFFVITEVHFGLVQIPERS